MQQSFHLAIMSFIVMSQSMLRSGYSVRDAALETLVSMAAAGDEVAVLQWIARNPTIDINGSNRYQRNALMQAASGGHAHVVKILLEHGASLEVCDEVQWSPFDYAFTGKHCDVMKILLEYGQDANCADSELRTLLMQATYQNELKVVELLLRYAADPHAVDVRNHCNPLHWALRRGKSAMVAMFARRGARMPRLGKECRGVAWLARYCPGQDPVSVAREWIQLRERSARAFLEAAGLPRVLETIVLEFDGSLEPRK